MNTKGLILFTTSILLELILIPLRLGIVSGLLTATRLEAKVIRAAGPWYAIIYVLDISGLDLKYMNKQSPLISLGKWFHFWLHRVILIASKLRLPRQFRTPF